jgi:hypothetical protein
MDIDRDYTQDLNAHGKKAVGTSHIVPGVRSRTGYLATKQ